MLANKKYPNPKEHVILSQQFSPSFLFELFDLTLEIKKSPEKFSKELSGKIVATLFYEPSTRTRLSFEAAAQRLGASVISTENAREFSSASKGETIEDTIRVASGYADFIVMRHFEDDSSKRALKASTVPLINAGSGKSQHPTQALLDAFTIFENFGRLDNLSLAAVGDLLRGRTADSLVYLLSKYENNKFLFVAPENSRLKAGLREHLKEHNIPFQEKDSLVDVLPEADVLYITRIQKERFADSQEYEAAKGKYILKKEHLNKMKSESIIMHPLPRVDEIETEVDSDPRAKYFEQAKNGLFVRMALLKLINDNVYGQA